MIDVKGSNKRALDSLSLDQTGLKFDGAGEVQDSLIQVVSECCEENYEMKSDKLSRAILALALATCAPGKDRAEHLNQCLSSCESAQFRLWVATKRLPPDDYPMQIGSYLFRKFKTASVRYLAGKHGTELPSWLSDYDGKLSIETPRWLALRLIPWNASDLVRFINRHQWDISSGESLLDEYYQAIAVIKRDEMRDFVSREQIILTAAGAAGDIEFYNEFEAVTLMEFRTELPKWGRTSMDYVGVMRNTCPKCVYDGMTEWMDANIGMSRIQENNPFKNMLVRFCEVLKGAHRSRIEGKIGWALLQFVMALELIFTRDREDSISRAISQCASLVSHRALGRTLEMQKMSVKAVYQSRSNLLHKGEEPSVKDLRMAESVCREVLFSLMAASRQGNFESVEQWIVEVREAATEASRRGIANDECLGRLGATTVLRNRGLNWIRDGMGN
jgi:hypothetical protein